MQSSRRDVLAIAALAALAGCLNTVEQSSVQHGDSPKEYGYGDVSSRTLRPHRGDDDRGRGPPDRDDSRRRGPPSRDDDDDGDDSDDTGDEPDSEDEPDDDHDATDGNGVYGEGYGQSPYGHPTE